ncbi:methyltransferase domain-containing protein [Polaribacter tangerinus]|uniref:methyltransferase domain-containing protein n=1 Tax=Polaribacter tangerinus TaxID=1920034 RepID=UPI000B4BB49D|nr:methyltransferase domain-containing protein [Polaribacter tangerinus]
MMNKNFAEKTYWETIYKGYKFKLLPTSNTIHKWVHQFFTKLPEGDIKDCFELGVFPGTYLSTFGYLGYRLNGVDQVDLVTTHLPEWLKSENFLVGDFYKKDIFKWQHTKQYDVVASFGFIEHFKDYKSVIKLQSNLVKKGGYIVLETPNFKGFIQYFLRTLLDKKNLKRHYVPSMNLVEWEKLLLDLGYEIVDSSYLGGYEFWVEDQKRNILQKGLLKVLKKLDIHLKKVLNTSNKHYSPFMGIIAKKK